MNDIKAAATVLTDERILAALGSITHEVPKRLPPGWLKFARAIEREVLAHTGVVATEKNDWRKAEQDAYIDAMWPAPRQTEITDTDSARDYLTKWMRNNFIGDTTFGYYIQKTLTGDFAYQLARAIEAKEWAGVTAEPAAPVETKELSPLRWLPIEQAPTDGTELLLTRWTTENGYGHVDFGAWGFIENSDYDDRPIYGWLSNYGNIDEPTHFINLAAPTIPTQVPAAEVRAQALGDAIDKVSKVGALWIDNSTREMAALILNEAIAAIRALKGQSTADSANTGALGEKGAEA